jgi:hypothetical protein
VYFLYDEFLHGEAQRSYRFPGAAPPPKRLTVLGLGSKFSSQFTGAFLGKRHTKKPLIERL